MPPDLTYSSTLSLQVETGVEMMSYPHRGPVRGVAWSDGGHMFATISDPFMDNDALISIYSTPRTANLESYSSTPVLEIDLPRENAVKGEVVASCLSDGLRKGAFF